MLEITLGLQDYFLTERGKYCADANAMTVMNEDECSAVAQRIFDIEHTKSFGPRNDDEDAPFGCFLRHQKAHKHYGINYRYYKGNEYKRNENNINASSICRKGNS